MSGAANAGELLQIEETTVADVDGWMLTCGNVMKGAWTDADGAAHTGLSAELGIYDDDRSLVAEPTVGPGSEVVVAGRRWRVVAVVDSGVTADNRQINGHVALEAQG